MLRCLDIVELLDEYLDGALDPLDAAALDRHLAGCHDCAAFMRTYRSTVRKSRELRASQLPPELRERLLTLVAQRGRPSTLRGAPAGIVPPAKNVIGRRRREHGESSSARRTASRLSLVDASGTFVARPERDESVVNRAFHDLGRMFGSSPVGDDIAMKHSGRREGGTRRALRVSDGQWSVMSSALWALGLLVTLVLLLTGLSAWTSRSIGRSVALVERNAPAVAPWISGTLRGEEAPYVP